MWGGEQYLHGGSDCCGLNSHCLRTTKLFHLSWSRCKMARLLSKNLRFAWFWLCQRLDWLLCYCPNLLSSCMITTSLMNISGEKNDELCILSTLLVQLQSLSCFENGSIHHSGAVRWWLNRSAWNAFHSESLHLPKADLWSLAAQPGARSVWWCKCLRFWRLIRLFPYTHWQRNRPPYLASLSKFLSPSYNSLRLTVLSLGLLAEPFLFSQQGTPCIFPSNLRPGGNVGPVIFNYTLV